LLGIGLIPYLLLEWSRNLTIILYAVDLLGGSRFATVAFDGSEEACQLYDGSEEACRCFAPVAFNGSEEAVAWLA
jgi:hypothetical protein